MCLSIMSLDPSKATGIDDIPAAFLKYCATPLCEPIHHLFVQRLAQSYLPTEWWAQMVTPLYKSGDECSVQNYTDLFLSSAVFLKF